MGERLRERSQELTRAELEIMQIIWSKGACFVNGILEQLPEPKPAYNTVSTVVRILEKKGYVDHKAYGKTHQYFPVVERDAYTQSFMSNVLDNFFGGSASRMVSFLSSNKNISVEEANEIMEMLKK